MAKKRAQKRKSEVKSEKPEENQNGDIANGDSTSESSSKKKKGSVSSVRNETSSNSSSASVAKKKSTTKAKPDEDETDYEVLKVVDVRYVKSNKREFLIRWKNYSPQYDSWEPEENLSCDDLISKYLADAEKRSKEPSKELRKKPSKVQLFTSPGNRRSKRSGGNRKNYIEEEAGDED